MVSAVMVIDGIALDSDLGVVDDGFQLEPEEEYDESGKEEIGTAASADTDDDKNGRDCASIEIEKQWTEHIKRVVKRRGMHRASRLLVPDLRAEKEKYGFVYSLFRIDVLAAVFAIALVSVPAAIAMCAVAGLIGVCWFLFSPLCSVSRDELDASRLEAALAAVCSIEDLALKIMSAVKRTELAARGFKTTGTASTVIRAENMDKSEPLQCIRARADAYSTLLAGTMTLMQSNTSPEGAAFDGSVPYSALIFALKEYRCARAALAADLLRSSRKCAVIRAEQILDGLPALYKPLMRACARLDGNKRQTADLAATLQVCPIKEKEQRQFLHACEQLRESLSQIDALLVSCTEHALLHPESLGTSQTKRLLNAARKKCIGMGDAREWEAASNAVLGDVRAAPPTSIEDDDIAADAAVDVCGVECDGESELEKSKEGDGSDDEQVNLVYEYSYQEEVAESANRSNGAEGGRAPVPASLMHELFKTLGEKDAPSEIVSTVKADDDDGGAYGGKGASGGDTRQLLSELEHVLKKV